uniref:YDG domain-containing protein n=1 Tax=Vitis vinifera TaxID=29760 RepID=A5BDJ9_VITVI|nr:hypothetical protein VITISV_011009 [Vitis vinifera]
MGSCTDFTIMVLPMEGQVAHGTKTAESFFTKIEEMMETNAILYPEKRFGPIPGVDVGHQFFSRAEMVAVGFHSHWLNGIDYMGQSYNRREYSGYTFPLAVAIVLSGQYEDDLDNSEDVVYTGQGGNNLLGNKRQVQDQVMERGNLALKNCMEQCVPVRVIRGHKSANSYVGKVYTYDGLYKLGFSFSGSFSFILAEKLKALKTNLKSWNKELFSNVSVRKELALNQVVFWEETSVLTLEEQNAKKQTKKEYKNSQNAFEQGTQILDVMLIANEALDLLKSNDRGLLCKLDIEKVYDHVLLLNLWQCGMGWRRGFTKSYVEKIVYSRGGRLILIRCILSSMPIYCMFLFYIQRTIKLLLEQIQRDFLWEGGALEWKPYLVRWDIPCSDKSKDGLGVKNLSTLHNAFLCKWSWRYAENKGALWKQVISCKYGVEGGWRAKEVVQYWAEKGVSGFTVFKYRLKRLEGQPILTTNQVQYARGRVPNSISEIRGYKVNCYLANALLLTVISLSCFVG